MCNAGFVLPVWYLCCTPIVLTRLFSVCRTTGQDNAGRTASRQPYRPGDGAVTPSCLCACPSGRTVRGATAAPRIRTPRAPHPTPPPTPRPRRGQTAPSPTTTLKHNTQTQTNRTFTDHSTETQHTDSNKLCLHRPQH